MIETEILFGRMTHDIVEDAPLVIVHAIDERVTMNPDEVDDYMIANHHDSYLIPSEFTGRIIWETTP